MRTFSLLTLLLPFVAANQHKHCYCQTWTAAGGWISNAGLTHYICYYNSNGAYYDDKTQRCEADKDYTIDGDEWENACKKYGVENGYYPFNAAGQPDTSKPLIKVGAAVGSCPNRG
ncbi:hypothetical protein E4U58_001670 [Claviceps cyperi]|nr:hypothetical protein E4U58_001670 [Claviceps cyperi]